MEKQTVDPLYMNREEYLQHQKKNLEMQRDQAEEIVCYNCLLNQQFDSDNKA